MKKKGMETLDFPKLIFSKMVYTTKFSNVVGDSNWPCLSYDIKQLVCIGLAKSSRMSTILFEFSLQTK